MAFFFATGTIIAAARKILRRIPQQALPVPPRGIVVHHSATRPSRQPFENAATLESKHKRRFIIKYNGRIYHIAYHYVILPDGAVEQGRPDKCRGAHTRSLKHNRWTGICLIGYFDPKWKDKRHHKPTPAQMDSLVSLSLKLMSRYNFDCGHILPHRDINPTECPGKSFPMEKYLARVRAEADKCLDAESRDQKTVRGLNCKTFLVS